MELKPLKFPYQQDHGYIKEIQKAGCAFLCYSFVLIQELGPEDFPVVYPETLNKFFEFAVSKGFVHSSGFVADPTRMLQVYLKKPCSVRHESPGYKPQETEEFREYELLDWRAPKRDGSGDWQHFTVGDGTGKTFVDVWRGGSGVLKMPGVRLLKKNIIRVSKK